MVGKRRKKALHKDFWQEIRKSRARFISIFCIVALGVAFFSGIQASSPDMRLSGDDYYNEVQLMDLKIVGTLGLTEDDIEAVREVLESCVPVTRLTLAIRYVMLLYFVQLRIAKVKRNLVCSLNSTCSILYLVTFKRSFLCFSTFY